MKITQISVFLENKKGRLYEVCDLLGKNKIDIKALTIAESPEFGILRIVVNKPQEALKLLKDNRLVANITEIVAVEVSDKPGGLAQVLRVINDNDLNVEYMYGFVEKRSENALLVFRFDDTDRAIAVLGKSGVKIVGKSDIGTL